MKFESINPADGSLIASYDGHASGQVDEILVKGEMAFKEWKQVSLEHRASLLTKCACHLRENANEYAQLITSEMGKVLSEAESEVEKCAWVCEYYAQNGTAFLADEDLEVENKEAVVTYEPLGCVLAIMPWNFPFWQVFRFAAPALMAGNIGLLKHASNVSGCALALQRIFEKSGFPSSVFQTLLIDSSEVQRVIEDERVHAVTLTGSEWAGSAVASVAGKSIKKSVLELGGSDPFIVLEDADINKAAEVGVKARMLNCGQSCIAAKRFIVVDSIANEFTQLFVEGMQRLKVGQPTNADVDYGPMARVDLAEQLQRQVDKSVEMGAKLILGGKRGDGAYFPATILSNVKHGMPAYHEELFGPVASIIVVGDDEEAVRVANDTSFGLGASVWTQDLIKGKNLARKIEAGAVFLNQMVASDPRIPFGGIKKSGYGRELSRFGIREFVNIKPIVS